MMHFNVKLEKVSHICMSTWAKFIMLSINNFLYSVCLFTLLKMNISKPFMIYNKDNLRYCILVEITTAS